MKKEMIICFLFAMIFIFHYLTAQKSLIKNKATAIYEVIYEYKTEVDVDQVNSAPAYLRKIAEDVEKFMAESRSVLLCNRTHSINYVETSINTTGMSEVAAKVLMRTNSTYFIDLPGKSAKIRRITPGDISTFILDNKIVWEISDETTIINGLKCIKAMGIIATPGFNDDKVIVWFTPDYPISMGPHGLFGLPGLILKYKHDSVIMTAKSIKNIESQKKTFEIPTSVNLEKNSEKMSKIKDDLPIKVKN